MLSAVARRVKSMSDDALIHSVVVKQATRVRENGGTYTVNWAGASTVGTYDCRLSPATPPQERLSAGSVTEIKDFWVVTANTVAIPKDSGNTLYRLEVTHDLTNIATPIVLYHKGTPIRSFEGLRKHLCSTEGGL